jgi:NhaP-type Na+/H+ or K+/H+ antiporter
VDELRPGALTELAPVAAERGFSFGDPYAFALLFGGLALFVAVGALAHQSGRPFSPAVVYLALGLAVALALDAANVELLDPLADPGIIEHATELAVIVALFSAGLKLDRPLGKRRWRSTLLLLGAVMPITIGAVALFGVYAMGLSLGAAILLGAVLSPTDPVLAGEVQVGPPGEGDEPEPRFALTSEAGLNDGLAFPFVFLGLFVAAEGGTGWLLEWLAADVVYAILAGIGIGFAGGRAIAATVHWLHARDWLLPQLDGWLAVASVLALYGITEVAGAYGFLAAFAGGLAYRRYEREHESHGRVHDGAVTVGAFSELATILLVASTVTVAGLGVPGVTGWLLVPVLLLIIRPLAVALVYRGTGVTRAERWFIGWFGIRGIGSFYYAAVVLGTGALTSAEQATLYWTVVACVAVSIVAHGLTGAPLAKRTVGESASPIP